MARRKKAVVAKDLEIVRDLKDSEEIEVSVEISDEVPEPAPKKKAPAKKAVVKKVAPKKKAPAKKRAPKKVVEPKPEESEEEVVPPPAPKKKAAPKRVLKKIPPPALEESDEAVEEDETVEVQTNTRKFEVIMDSIESRDGSPEFEGSLTKTGTGVYEGKGGPGQAARKAFSQIARHIQKQVGDKDAVFSYVFSIKELKSDKAPRFYIGTRARLEVSKKVTRKGNEPYEIWYQSSVKAFRSDK